MARMKKQAKSTRGSTPWQDEPAPPWDTDEPYEVTRIAPHDDLEAPEATRQIDGVPTQVPIRTLYSEQAALIAEMVRDKFDNRQFGRAPYRVLRIDQPEGPSTAGGLLARQTISLVARQGPAPSIICGWVDTSSKEAQLRSYQSVARRYESRHGIGLDVSSQVYEHMLDDLVRTLLAGGMKVRVLIPDDLLDAGTPEQTQGVKQPAVRPRRGWLLPFFTFLLGLLVSRWIPWERLEPLWQRLAPLRELLDSFLRS
jgi:hypothetical protein